MGLPRSTNRSTPPAWRRSSSAKAGGLVFHGRGIFVLPLTAVYPRGARRQPITDAW